MSTREKEIKNSNAAGASSASPQSCTPPDSDPFTPSWQVDHLIRHMQGVSKAQAFQLRLVLLYLTLEWLFVVSEGKHVSVLGIDPGNWYQLIVVGLHLALVTSLTAFRSATLETKTTLNRIERLARHPDGSLPQLLQAEGALGILRLWNIDEHMNYVDYVEETVARHFGWRVGPLVYPVFEMSCFTASWFASVTVFKTFETTTTVFFYSMVITLFLSLCMSGLFLFEWLPSLRTRLRKVLGPSTDVGDGKAAVRAKSQRAGAKPPSSAAKHRLEPDATRPRPGGAG
jgi:hypothetical protein